MMNDEYAGLDNSTNPFDIEIDTGCFSWCSGWSDDYGDNE